MRTIYFLKIIYLLVILSSCSPNIMCIYGIRKPNEISKQKIIKYANRLDLPSDKIYELDTTYF